MPPHLLPSNALARHGIASLIVPHVLDFAYHSILIKVVVYCWGEGVMGRSRRGSKGTGLLILTSSLRVSDKVSTEAGINRRMFGRIRIILFKIHGQAF